MAKKTISTNQKSMLLEFIEEHPVMVIQRQSNQFTNADNTRLWQELTKKLNSIPGAAKTWKEWRKTWSDIKTRTKKKLSENKKEAAKTGGGPNTPNVVDETEEKILEIIGGNVLIEGLDIPEIGIPIQTNNNWDHQYVQLQEPVVELMDANEEVFEEAQLNNNDVEIAQKIKSYPKEVTQQNKKAVRPPLRMPNRRRLLNPYKAAFDLVAATEKTNEIQEKYYIEKLMLMKEMHKDNINLKKEYIELKKEEIELKKQQINVQEKLSSSLEVLISNMEFKILTGCPHSGKSEK